MAGLTRRDLLTFWRRPAQAPPPPAVLRPPGALPEAEFLDACQRCGRCAEVCPRQAILPMPGGPGAGAPFILARQAPCVVCVGLECTHACPSGALKPLPVNDPRQIRMGTAELAPAKCRAYAGEDCQVCIDSCPIPGAIDLKIQRGLAVPVVEAEVCVGCGLCEHYCPTEPAAIRVRPAR